jgi:hypothetical protein
MREPTTQDIDALIGASTPHFAFQIRERVERLIVALPEDHPVRAYAEQRLAVLDQLGYANSRAEGGDPSAPRRG